MGSPDVATPQSSQSRGVKGLKAAFAGARAQVGRDLVASAVCSLPITPIENPSIEEDQVVIGEVKVKVSKRSCQPTELQFVYRNTYFGSVGAVQTAGFIK